MADAPGDRSVEARDGVLRSLFAVLKGLPDELLSGLRLFGGLIPEALVDPSAPAHQGTRDADLQVDLVLRHGVSMRPLEDAMLNNGFSPVGVGGWRWTGPGKIKIEFLCDVTDAEPDTTHRLADCEEISGMNLRGTGYAVRATPTPSAQLPFEGGLVDSPVPVAGLAGYLAAKLAAAAQRDLERDLYDLAYVLTWNRHGGPAPAATLVADEFSSELAVVVALATQVARNFQTPHDRGSRAYAAGMASTRDEADELAAQATAAFGEFAAALTEH